MPSQMFVLTVAAGKRLIAKGIAQNPIVKNAIETHKLVVIAGTTNAYVMQELCPGQDTAGFYRGTTTAPGKALPIRDGLCDCVVTKDGVDASRDIFAIAPELGAGDVILKGANAVHLSSGEAGVLIGSEVTGTIGACTPAVIGRRVQLILPVGVEKRVDEPISVLAAAANAPDGAGPRLYPAPGKAYTEIDAIAELTGCKARIAAAGGVLGAEGAAYFLCEGTKEQLAACAELVRSVVKEPAFS